MGQDVPQMTRKADETYHANGKHSAWDLPRSEESMKPPKARARPIVVQAFHVWVTFTHCSNIVAKCQHHEGGTGQRLLLKRTVCLRSYNFRQQIFAFTVSVQQATLTAFLVVDDKVDGHFGTVLPGWFGWFFGIADRVAASVLGVSVVLVLTFPGGLHASMLLGKKLSNCGDESHGHLLNCTYRKM